MANKKIWLGMLVMVLVFSMTVVSCGDDNGATNLLDIMELSTANPNSAALNIGNITLAQFNEVKELLDGYQGWSTHGGEELRIVWTGRTQAQADAAEDALDELSWIDSKSYGLIFYLTRMEYDGFYMPAGTVMVYFDW